MRRGRGQTDPRVPFSSPGFHGIAVHRRCYIHDEETEEVTSGEHWELPEEMSGHDPSEDRCEFCGRLVQATHAFLCMYIPR